MPRRVWEIEINEDTSRADLELCLIEATRSSDTNVQNAAARAKAEIWLRDSKEERRLFDAESGERVKSQKFQEAQFAKQLDVAKQQALSARRAVNAAWASAFAAVALVIVAVTQLLISE